LEFIEAMYLFAVSAKQIEIVVHPQSIIHSLVTFKDGSTLAQLSRPTMHIPIAYALHFPKRLAIQHQPLNLAGLQVMSFEAPDLARFPLLKLALDVADGGQAAQIIANCANEYAVNKFLNDEIGFLDIFEIVDGALQSIEGMPINSIECVTELAQRTVQWCAQGSISSIE
jgi:1-deoxy-D-xylulose-5-phosphate reductoisomerase